MSSTVVYSDINTNIIDGSSVWLVSITEALSIFQNKVFLLLKAPIENDRLIGRLKKIPNIELIEPESTLTISEARQHIRTLIIEKEVNHVVARGLEVCNTFVQDNTVAKKLWSYVTDLPYPHTKLSANSLNRLRRIAARSRRIFAQTEAARSYWESIISASVGKVVLINPMIPDDFFLGAEAVKQEDTGKEIRILYSGKMAKSWKTLEMLTLPQVLKERGIPSTLFVAGDKFNRDSSDPQWVSRMKKALEEAHSDPESGVTWLGGITRDACNDLIFTCDFGIGWRDAALDSSMEISTKMLEYVAGKAIPIVNASSDNLDLFGDDYPCFVGKNADVEELADVIENVYRDGRINDIAGDMQSMAFSYSMTSTAQRLKEAFERAEFATERDIDTAPLKLLVVSHDFKFMGDILPIFESDPAFDVKCDVWESLRDHDEEESEKLCKWADVVFCEFAGPSVVWYSNRLEKSQRLYTRVHGFEIRNNAPWWKDVDFSRVDKLLFVSEYYQRLAMELLPIESGQTVVVPNSVSYFDLARPKKKDAQFHVGIVGIVPFLKRPDRALDLISALIEHDSRYVLHIKGKMPWRYPWVWVNALEKQQYMDFFSRVASDPVLANHVVFESFSPDIANWLRGIGFVLSPSTQESFHLAPAEGMASGAVPIVWPREGAVEIFGQSNVYASVDEMRDYILSLRLPEDFLSVSRKVQNYAKKWDITNIYSLWKTIFLDNSEL